MAQRYLLAAWLVLGASQCVSADNLDWPMWRNDAVRSGTTQAGLASQLHLQWTRRLPAPKPAWPNEARLHFDASYEPVILGSRLFVGSMMDGSVTAFDCESGRALWKFYSNGPVRLAPVAFESSVCFGSDDGWLYCLDVENGRLRWKVSGAPEDRPRYKHLGNANLVSFWPVRGGPVHRDGIVYFGAGIWPTLGVFVRAVEANSGRILWTNDTSHAIENVRIDHNYTQESGISPQGHMLIQDDMVIVPNGRSMPARLDRHSGKMHYFVQGYRNGDSRVVVSGDLALVGMSGVVSLKDGREIANRWVEAGKEAPEGWSGAKVDLFEGPLFPYKHQPACDYRCAIDGQVAYGIEEGVVYAFDLQRAAVSLYDKEFNGKAIQPARWDAPVVWKLDTQSDNQQNKQPGRTNTLIKAGDRLYGHVGNSLFAVQLPSSGKSASLAWKKSLASEPASIAAARGRLFVATRDGVIHCFGREPVEPLAYEEDDPPQPTDSEEDVKRVQTLIKAAKRNSGYAIVAGLRDGQLVEQLLRQSEFLVIAIDEDQALVDRLRGKLAKLQFASGRFQAIVATPTEAMLPPYLADLITSERTETWRLDTGSPLADMYQSLRPYGGAICLPGREVSEQTVLAKLDAERCASFALESADGWTVLRRVGHLPGAVDWTHESGDAARSFFSRDEQVKAPLAVLWYGDGRDHGFYKRKDYGHGLKPQVAGGRLFALQVATNSLKAVDAYTGRLLWSRELGSSARYVSMPDAVYVADERKCLILDPATGEIKDTFLLAIPEEHSDGPVSATDIRVGDDVILIAVRFNKENAISKGRWNARLLVTLDRRSGKQLWSRTADLRYNLAALAIAKDRVFCVDSHSPEVIGMMRRRGQDVAKLPSTILALDAQSGRELWKVVEASPPANLGSLHFMSLRTQDDWLAYSTDHDLLITGKANQTVARKAATGEEIWRKPIRGQQPLILGAETFINQTGHTYEVATGQLVSGSALFRRGGCNYAVGSANLLFLRSNCATYVDIETREEYAIRNLRSGCSNSLVAANGILNAPCFSVGCVCNYPIQTSFAMFHLPQAKVWHGNPRKQ